MDLSKINLNTGTHTDWFMLQLEVYSILFLYILNCVVFIIVCTYSLIGYLLSPWGEKEWLQMMLGSSVCPKKIFMLLSLLVKFLDLPRKSLKGKYHANLMSFQNPKMFVCQQKQRNNCQACYKLSSQCKKTVH